MKEAFIEDDKQWVYEVGMKEAFIEDDKQWDV